MEMNQSNTTTTLPYNNDYNPTLQTFKCKICQTTFEKEENTAWEIHKLNHTLVALKNIIDRKGDKLY